MSARDLVLLEESHRIKAMDRLVQDLQRVGLHRASLETWLGHPVHEMTGAEAEQLEQWHEDAEQALREGKRRRIPHLPPRRTPPTG